MIIKSSSKKDTTEKNLSIPKNDYKIIYQKIKEEIKSVVINRLLYQVQLLSSNFKKLEKENSLIKNDLIYILKRILANKNDYTSNFSNITQSKTLKSCFSNPYLSNNQLLNCKSYNSILSAETVNENNNISSYKNLENNRLNHSINKRPIEIRRYSIDDDTKKVNENSVNNLENSIQFNMNNKVEHYLNALYKHNFAEECATGIPSNHLLNKEQSLYDELFSKKKKNFPFLKTDINFHKINNLKKKKKKWSREVVNNNDNNKNDKMDKIYRNNNYDAKLQKNNYMNKIKKGSAIENRDIKLPNSDMKSSYYYKQNIQNKIQSRSRFLVNKLLI